MLSLRKALIVFVFVIFSIPPVIASEDKPDPYGFWGGEIEIPNVESEVWLSPIAILEKEDKVYVYFKYNSWHGKGFYIYDLKNKFLDFDILESLFPISEVPCETYKSACERKRDELFIKETLQAFKTAGFEITRPNSQPGEGREDKPIEDKLHFSPKQEKYLQKYISKPDPVSSFKGETRLRGNKFYHFGQYHLKSGKILVQSKAMTIKPGVTFCVPAIKTFLTVFDEEINFQAQTMVLKSSEFVVSQRPSSGKFFYCEEEDHATFSLYTHKFFELSDGTLLLFFANSSLYLRLSQDLETKLPSSETQIFLRDPLDIIECVDRLIPENRHEWDSYWNPEAPIELVGLSEYMDSGVTNFVQTGVCESKAPYQVYP